MSLKSVLLILLFIGMLLIIIGLTNVIINHKCIQKECSCENDNPLFKPAYPSDIFYDMFHDQSPWIRDINVHAENRSEELNKYFISQS